ncbi:MAG: TIGR01777 family oxidoreductase [Opitutales bacterium]
MKHKIILAGGSGFLGQALAKRFSELGSEIVVLGRGSGIPNGFPTTRFVNWDAKTLGDWSEELEGTDALVNLCGRSVDCRYNEENRRQILNSRTNATRVLGEACTATANPPRIWLNASTATIYEDRRGDLAPHDECSKDLGHGFSVGVAKAWEKAFFEAEVPNIRQIAMRISIVLGASGGAFPVMRRFAQLGLGGRQGPGSQWMSWLHLDDFVGIVEWLLENEEVDGSVNLAAPNPVTNASFMREMRRRFAPLGFGFPAPAFAVQLGAVFLRTAPELVLKSRKVVSRVLLKGGYEFRFPKIEEAIADLSG